MAEYDLVSVDEVLHFLNKQNASEVPEITVLISRASSWLELMLDRKLKSRTFSNLRLTGPVVPKLYLDAWPVVVTEPISVTLDGAALTVWTDEVDGDPETFDMMVASDDPHDERWGLRNHLYRLGGWVSANAWNYPGPWLGGHPRPFGHVASHVRPYRLLLSYTGGFEVVPDDLKMACLYLVQRLAQDIEQGGPGASVVQPTGGSRNFADADIPVNTVMLARPYGRNPHLVGIHGVKRLSRFAVSF